MCLNEHPLAASAWHSPGSFQRRLFVGRDNSCVVDDKKVALLQVFCYIVKMLVGDSVTFSVVHEHTTAVPRLCRCLGDKLLRKVIVKVAGFQVCHCFLGYCPIPYICGALLRVRGD